MVCTEIQAEIHCLLSLTALLIIIGVLGTVSRNFENKLNKLKK